MVEFYGYMHTKVKNTQSSVYTLSITHKSTLCLFYCANKPLVHQINQLTHYKLVING